jgi:uncharacterized RDD family membrane protein YckC
MHEASIHVSRNGQQLGVFTELQLEAGLAHGAVQADDLCWTSGMAEWASLRTAFPHLVGNMTTGSTARPHTPKPTTTSPTPLDAPVYPTGMERFRASLIDGLFQLLVVIAVGFLTAGASAALIQASGWHPSHEEEEGLVILGFVLVVFSCQMCYYGLQGTAPKNATWGQRYIGIKMVDANTGYAPSSGHIWKWASLQTLSRWLGQCYFLGYLAFLPILPNPRKQSLLDSWSDIVMVKNK